jgi:hypothetical protein
MLPIAGFSCRARVQGGLTVIFYPTLPGKSRCCLLVDIGFKPLSTSLLNPRNIVQIDLKAAV